MLPSLSTAPVRPADIHDEDEFEGLLGPLMLPAYRLAYGMLRDPAEAEDAVQEAALRAWQHRRSFHAGAQLRPWFFAIVANQCRSARRGRWWSVLRLAEPERPQGHHADEETRLDLRRALARIGYDERLVLVLRYYMDLGYEEVALTLGISEQAARSRTHRAVRRLRPQVVVSEEPLA
jgi:RNA polymerase sigma-70 factor (ECF subfamily)